MIDLHVHSALSDGTDAVPDLVTAAVAAGLTVMALTDHDTLAGVDQARALGRSAGLDVMTGVEVSTHLDRPDGGRRSVHLLGYGLRPDDPVLAATLARTRQARVERVPAMMAKLSALGVGLADDDIAAVSRGARTIGRPHLADALVRRGYIGSRDEAFRRWLYEGGPAYVGHATPTTPEAVEVVVAAGGLPVLAHPWGRGNEDIVTAGVIADLVDRGLVGLEVDHVDHTAPQRQGLRDLAHRFGLLITGGSDYHGTGKTRNPLGVNTTTAAVYQSLRRIVSDRGGCDDPR